MIWCAWICNKIMFEAQAESMFVCSTAAGTVPRGALSTEAGDFHWD
jgi:hypothetical protein